MISNHFQEFRGSKTIYNILQDLKSSVRVLEDLQTIYKSFRGFKPIYKSFRESKTFAENVDCLSGLKSIASSASSEINILF